MKLKFLLIKTAPFAMVLLSLVGVSDAAYLTRAHYEGLALGCLTIGGCEKVTASQYATVGNIPLALLGSVYYFLIFALIVAYFILDRRKKNQFTGLILAVAGRLTIVGFVVSLFLVYLQLFVIQAICLYCMVSALTSTLLFIFGMALLRLRRDLARQEASVI